MSDETGIAWTDHTWNPWQGCARVSPGCDHCYMYRDKKRYGQDPERVVRSAAATFRRPLKWNREAKAAGIVRRVFVASWADFFGAEGDAWRADAWEIIRQCDSLIFQVLTKRHARIRDCLPADWGDGWPNVWLGVTGENQEWADRRWAALRRVPARVRFVSYEPAIGSLTMTNWSTVPDWLIIGGESGSGARGFYPWWARTLIAECRVRGCAPFMKQFGANVMRSPCRGCADRASVTDPCLNDGLPCSGLRDRSGADMSEWPEELRVREFPEVRS